MLQGIAVARLAAAALSAAVHAASLPSRYRWLLAWRPASGLGTA
jgi:hypothetical protein